MCEYIDTFLYIWLVKPVFGEEIQYLYKIKLESYSEEDGENKYYTSKKWELIYSSLSDFKEPLADIKSKLILKLYKNHFKICIYENKFHEDEFYEIDYWIMKNDICILKNFFRQPFINYELDNSETYEYYLKLFGTIEEKKNYCNTITRSMNRIRENIDNQIKELRKKLKGQIELYEGVMKSLFE